MQHLRLKENNISEILKNIELTLRQTTQASNLKIDITDYLPKKEFKEKPRIYIKNDIYEKMFALVTESDVEISWHLFINRDEDKYYVYDIILFPQINGSTSTTTDQDEYAKWMTDLMQNKHIVFENLRGHGHSHVNMNVFSSAIDDQYQEDLLHSVIDDDYYIFFILNKKREMCVLLYDFKSQTLFETRDLEVIILDSKDDPIKSWAEAQIKEYCKKPSTPSNKRLYPKTDYYYHYGYPYDNIENSQLELDALVKEQENKVLDVPRKKKGIKRHGSK